LWSSYIDEAIHLFPDAQVYFASHHWPHWGSETITAFLKQQRDTYKYIHDQTMRLAGAGMTPREIAAEIQLPGSLATIFSNRGYYGTISHNSRAVYQHYFGWYDGNPANLDPLPPVEAGRLYVKAMGGSEQVLKIAQSAFDAADYRWVAELLNHLVFAEPDNQRAKKLLASTYDQLGFQAEAGTWRDIYLTGASELRNGVPSTTINLANALELLQQTPVPRFFDAMATRINGPKADGLNMIVNIVFTDLDESYVLNLENAVLHHRQAPNSPDANATLTLTHTLFEDADRGSENYRSFTLG
jgi:alkyl sulfatase BDS1-like metallo-beta-lactamase superfamily hydrolase